MRLVDLLLIRKSDSLHPQTRSVSVFTAPESLVAFPIATSIVVTIARAARTIAGMDSESVAAPLAGAFVLGSVITIISIIDTRSRPQTLREWLTALFVAATNSLVLFAAALGVEKF
jgi:hypothetical protein